MAQGELTTARLRLRPAREGDAARLSALSADPLVPRMTTRIPRDNPPGRVAGSLREMAARGERVFVVEDGEGAQGLAALGPPGLGYWIGRAARGRGYATEAARAVIAHGFRDLGLAAVTASVFVDNPVSRRVLDRLGFLPVRRSRTWSVGRGAEVEQTDMVLTRAAWRP